MDGKVVGGGWGSSGRWMGVGVGIYGAGGDGGK